MFQYTNIFYYFKTDLKFFYDLFDSDILLLKLMYYDIEYWTFPKSFAFVCQKNIVKKIISIKQ